MIASLLWRPGIRSKTEHPTAQKTKWLTSKQSDSRPLVHICGSWINHSSVGNTLGVIRVICSLRKSALPPFLLSYLQSETFSLSCSLSSLLLQFFPFHVTSLSIAFPFYTPLFLFHLVQLPYYPIYGPTASCWGPGHSCQARKGEEEDAEVWVSRCGWRGLWGGKREKAAGSGLRGVLQNVSVRAE